MPNSSSSLGAPHTNALTTIATTVAFVAAPILYSRYFKAEGNDKDNNKGDETTVTLSSIARGGSQLRPPFPAVVRSMLSKCRLAYLSTVDMEEGSSHLSLMRFTYYCDEQDGEVIILSTNKKTKKFDMLQKQKGVALLIHDFGQADDDNDNNNNNNNSNAAAVGGLYSITLNGICSVVTDPHKAEAYRREHLAHNPEYPQFIVGEDIAILCVDVTKARVCDIHDQVTKWDLAEQQQQGKQGG